MPMMPFQILGIWLRGLLALALLGLGVYLVRDFYEARRPRPVHEVEAPAEVDARAPATERADRDREVVVVRRADWTPGLDRESLLLALGVLLIVGSLGGGWGGYRVWSSWHAGQHEPDSTDTFEPSKSADRLGTVQRVRRPDGAELHAVVVGPEDAPPLVLTHGWGVDSDEWRYELPRLAERHRVIAWDLPGTGRSSRHPDNDFSLERMAEDLDAVIGLAGGRPVVVVGHSIGGMIALTYCRTHPEALGTKVAGLALVHTTFTNPVKTTERSKLYEALQKPVLEPLCYLMIALAPIVWVMNALSYLNGSSHRSTERTSFSGREPWEKLDFVARYMAKYWPATLARGMLAMFRYDAKDVLGTIGVPTLVVAGSRDNTTLPWAHGVIAESIPQASLVTLDDMKHEGHMERDQTFAEVLEGFVATVPSLAQRAEPMTVETR